MTSTDGNANQASLGRRIGRNLKSILLWDHDRGSWQYDVMVGLILAFVFLTPARWFHDRPVYNTGLLDDVTLMERGPAGHRYRVSAELLLLYDDDPRKAAEMVLQRNLDHPFVITDIKEVDAEGGENAAWYDVWLRVAGD